MSIPLRSRPLLASAPLLLAVLCLALAGTDAGAPREAAVNSELTEKMSWKCANNASCLYALANSVMNSYRRGETIQFGVFDLQKLPPANRNSTTRTTTTTSRSGSGAGSSTGRGAQSSLVEFLSGNAIRIPVGPMVFSVQRAEEDGDYIEVALLKKATTQGRRSGGADDGEAGRLGGGGGHLHRRHEKKQLQMLIPMYLAATTFGWTMLAAKAVGLLTLKALAISKLAFVVASMVIIKKLMDNANEKMMYHFPEQTPYIVPYSMDYGMHPMGGSEISTGDMYPAAIHMAAAGGAGMHPGVGHPGLESLGAESNLHQNVAEVHNNTQILAALNGVPPTGLGLGHGLGQGQGQGQSLSQGLGQGLSLGQSQAQGQVQKVKREDSWLMAKRRKYRRPHRHRHRPRLPLRHGHPAMAGLTAQSYANGEAYAIAAAAMVAEESAERDDRSSSEEQDDIFNEAESIKDTLEFLGMEIKPRRPLLYNYLKSHPPYFAGRH